MYGLARRKNGLDRNLIANGEIRHLGNWQRSAAMSYLNFKRGTSEIERRWIRICEAGNRKEQLTANAQPRNHTGF
jgi:hypothetical protein